MSLREGHGPLHRAAVVPKSELLGAGAGAFGQPVPAADDLGRVVEGQLVAVVGQLALQRGRRSYLSSTVRTRTL